MNLRNKVLVWLILVLAIIAALVLAQDASSHPTAQVSPLATPVPGETPVPIEPAWLVIARADSFYVEWYDMCLSTGTLKGSCIWMVDKMRQGGYYEDPSTFENYCMNMGHCDTPTPTVVAPPTIAPTATVTPTLAPTATPTPLPDTVRYGIAIYTDQEHIVTNPRAFTGWALVQTTAADKEWPAGDSYMTLTWGQFTTMCVAYDDEVASHQTDEWTALHGFVVATSTIETSAGTFVVACREYQPDESAVFYGAGADPASAHMYFVVWRSGWGVAP